MSDRLSAKEICEGALRIIGAYAINDTGADPHELEVTLDVLDDILGETAGTLDPALWLVGSTVSMTLTGGVGEYDLLATLGSSAPDFGYFRVLNAYLDRGNGVHDPLDVVDRTTYENIEKKSQSGDPELLWIDRLQVPTLKTWPILGSTVTGYSLGLVIQSLSPNVRDTRHGNESSSLPATWNRWAKLALAYDISGGPVRRLPKSGRSEIAGDRNDALRLLEAYDNREKTTGPRVVRFRDF